MPPSETERTSAPLVRDGFVTKDAVRRLLSGDVQRVLPSMRIGAVLRPAVLVTFVDGAGLLQHGERPASRSKSSADLSFVVSIDVTPPRRILPPHRLLQAVRHRTAIRN